VCKIHVFVIDEENLDTHLHRIVDFCGYQGFGFSFFSLHSAFCVWVPTSEHPNLQQQKFVVSMLDWVKGRHTKPGEDCAFCTSSGEYFDGAELRIPVVLSPPRFTDPAF
jgi:hypothetical protein